MPRVMALAPVALLLSLVLLLPCCTSTPSAATSGDSASGASSHDGTPSLDDWISGVVHDFDKRMAEIAGDAKCAQLDKRLRVAENHRRVITVRQDGRGDFGTVGEAVASIPEKNSRRTVVLIGLGAYRERVRVAKTKPYVTFYGDPEAMPTITFDATAAQYGTWESATVAVESHYFMACNVVFENSAPMPQFGVKGAQAVAMRISGDKAAFYNCKFYGFQDTLCDDKGKHYFRDCLIRGTVDYIFGNGRSIYKYCNIESVAPSKGVTAIVAQGRDRVASKGGFSFVHCNITGSGDAYLSRAWRESSRVVFAYTYMGTVVNAKGWDDRGRHERDQTVFYGEYECIGPGAATGDRVSYSRILTDKQVQPFLSRTFIRASKWLLPPPKV